jgi:hypothetical protein
MAQLAMFLSRGVDRPIVIDPNRRTERPLLVGVPGCDNVCAMVAEAVNRRVRPMFGVRRLALAFHNARGVPQPGSRGSILL